MSTLDARQSRPAFSRIGHRLRRVTGDAPLTIAPVLFLAVAAWHHRWVTDDAFIDFRVVANLHHGLGPVFNAGERVEAYTSPMWIAMLWLVSGVIRFVALEWIAVVVGLAASVTGTYAAARGSALLWRSTGRAGPAIPIGVVVLVAIPPMWDFSTSGLETGLTFLWLGGCFWMVARAAVGPSSPSWPVRLGAVAIGSGPLVRPDLGIFSVTFLVALLLSPAAATRASKLRLVAWALVLPVAYEAFRMGYFASLEPNTALAKEAGGADWSRGWRYLKDFVDPYVLFIPLALVFAYSVLELRGTWRGVGRAVRAAALAGGAGGLLHGLYIVRVGGDFMHARMLLPSLFGLLLPVAVVVPRRRVRSALLPLVVVVWAVVCAAGLRGPYAKHFASGVFEDEHAAYVDFAHTPHPITLGDYARTPWATAGFDVRRLSARGTTLVLVPSVPIRLNRRPWPGPATLVTPGQAIGLFGYAAGPRVHIVDQFGLADPLGSRLRIGPLELPSGLIHRGDKWTVRYRHLPPRWRPGHEKYLPMDWIVARYASFDVLNAEARAYVSEDGVAAAQRALRCGPLRRLLSAVDAPLTFGRFLSNLTSSFALTTLRFPSDPTSAARSLCHSRRAHRAAAS